MSIRLEPLGPRHGAQILRGQDDALAREISGRPWQPAALEAFLQRSAQWREDGPIREYAAVRDGSASTGDPAALIGGGGMNLLAAGPGSGQASLTYWVLAAHRGRGHGRAVGAALVAIARADARIRHLVLRIAPHNTASQRVARSLGATPTGTLEHHPADATRTVEPWMLDVDPV